MRRPYRRRSDNDSMPLIVLLLLAFYALPLVGLYFLLREDPSKRELGIILLVVGIILWIIVGVSA